MTYSWMLLVAAVAIFAYHDAASMEVGAVRVGAFAAIPAPAVELTLRVLGRPLATTLGGLALGLQGTEESFFGTQDLDGRGWVL